MKIFSIQIKKLLWSQQSNKKSPYKYFDFCYRWIFTRDIEQVALQKLVG